MSHAIRLAELGYGFFVILIILSLFHASITGLAVEDQPSTISDIQKTDQDIKRDLENFIQRFPLTSLAGEGARVCILIPNQGNILSFLVQKESGSPSLSEADYSCGGQFENDFIISYTNLDSFYKHSGDPSCGNLINGGRGVDFYYYPSRLMEQGGIPVCDSEFQQKYCAAVSFCAKEELLMQRQLSCCSESQLSDEQKTMISGAIDQYGYLSKSAITESPSAMKFSRVNVMLQQNYAYLLAIIAFVIIFGVSLEVLHAKKSAAKKQKQSALSPEAYEELKNYVGSALKQGYDENTMKRFLLSYGWPEDNVNKAIEETRIKKSKEPEPKKS
ncbi:hypothetical protein ACFL0W_02975 [Nanoarchaeota archaeon]